MNLRSKSKRRTATPRTAPKRKSTVPGSNRASESDHVHLSEAALRKLPRVRLQKIAKANKVKANIKTDSIIQQLLDIEKKRHAEDDREQGPSRKRVQRDVSSDEHPFSSVSDNQATSNWFSNTGEIGNQSNEADPSSINEPQLPEAGPSASQPTQVDKEHTVLSYDKDLFSGTESEMIEEDQPGFATPISSRAGTPPLAHPNDLRRCVRIMQEMSAKDQALLKEVMKIDETAERLRTRAKEVRDLTKAERSRRERMEDYFRYWQEVQPRWDRRWMYGENIMSDQEMRLREMDAPTGPPTVPTHQRDQETEESDGRTQLAAPVHAQRPTLSLDELRQLKQAIMSKQGADRHQLESQHQREELDEDTSSDESSQTAGVRDLGGGRHRGDIPSTDDVNELLLSFDEGAVAGPSRRRSP